ncbi:uncharacterized protein LOC144159440 [Haemaphysalis longicornis]
MFAHVAATFLFTAVWWCAGASPAHVDFAVDQLLGATSVDVLSLPDISFDVDNQRNWTFSGYVEFHLYNGTLVNLRRRVRRVGECGVRGSDIGTPTVELWCNLNLRGVVAKYDVEVIVDDNASTVVADLLVDTGNIFLKIESRQENCTECSQFTDFQVTDVTARLKPFGKTLNHPSDVLERFGTEVVARAPKHIAYAFSTAYKRALAEKITPLRATDFTD